MAAAQVATTADNAARSLARDIAHTFVDKSFKAPTYCQVCHGFILGIGKKSSTW
jgi:hypothetical protein